MNKEFKLRRGGRVALMLLVGLCSIQAQSQRKGNFISRYVNGIINDTTDVSKPRFLIYPTVAFSPETSWEFGASGLYVYHAKEDTLNRLSEINGFTFFTLEQQFGVLLDHAIYSDQDRWFLLGNLRFQSFPLLYYGIGPDTPPEFSARVDAVQLQLTERVLRRVYKNFYLGAEFDLQTLTQVDFVTPDEEPILLPIGNEGSTNFGIGAGLVYDDRHNVLNVRKGMFSELSILRYDDTWGSDYSFTRIVSDSRIYRPVNKGNVLAFQLLGRFNSGAVPFNQLALLGGESMMRGYYLGRYRDENLVATQLEYRFLPLPLGFTERLGAVVFGSTGAVFDRFGSLSTADMLFTGGVGLRYLVFPKRDIYTRFDVAFTEEGPGFYLFVGESF